MKKLGIIIGLFLCILVIRCVTFFTTQHTYRIGEKVTLTYTFLDEPKTTATTQTFIVNNLKVFTARYPEYHYGDTVEIVGRVESNSHGQLSIKTPQIEHKKSNFSFFLAPLSWIRERIQSTFNLYLSRKDASLLMGIVFGIKSNFDYSFYQDLKNTGVLHVIAASGMNVTLVSEFLLILLLPFCNRKIALFLSIIGIVFYAVLSGLAASIVRASLMSSSSFAAQIIGRQYTALYVLSLVAGVMVFVSPELVFDVGFQLSFASTLGILLLKPLIDHIKGVSYLTAHIFLLEDMTTTFAAQITTLPLFFITFGSYSPISLVVNILILWTVPFLMILGGVAALISLILPQVASIVLYCTLPLLWYFEWIVSLFSHVTGQVTLKNIPLLIWFGYYLIVLAILIWVKRRSNREN